MVLPVMFWTGSRAAEHGRSVASTLGHDVEAVVDSVDQIDVGMAGRAEHDLGPARPSFLTSALLGREVRGTPRSPRSGPLAIGRRCGGPATSPGSCAQQLGLAIVEVARKRAHPL